MDHERLGDHRWLGRAPFGQPLMGDNDVLQLQEYLRIEIVTRCNFPYDIAALQDMSYQLPLGRVHRALRLLNQFPDFADIVQDSAGEDQIPHRDTVSDSSTGFEWG